MIERLAVVAVLPAWTASAAGFVWWVGALTAYDVARQAVRRISGT